MPHRGIHNPTAFQHRDNNENGKRWRLGRDRFVFIYLEAVKICLELVHMALMGLSWPLTSPMGVKLSTFHTFNMPPRQALSSMGRPGTYARAQTQSLWALGICCRVRERHRRDFTSSCDFIKYHGRKGEAVYLVSVFKSSKNALWFISHGYRSPSIRLCSLSYMENPPCC